MLPPFIRAGTVPDCKRDSGDWVFIDIGFASEKRSCGILVGDGQPKSVSFADLQVLLMSVCQASDRPLNLVIEAPLSVAFGANGNPTGRAIEKRNGQARYWYVGLGCSVLVATTYLLRSVHDLPLAREVRLFEGLVSFKTKGKASSHTEDVIALRDIAWRTTRAQGRVVAPTALASAPGDRVVSAFRVSGMDFGVPPVIAVDDSLSQ